MLVGEMRDLESIASALTIAETGHLVLATLHTNDSAQAIDRIIDVFPAERRPQIQVQLAGTLLAVVYQRLVPKVRRGHGRRLRGHGRQSRPCATWSGRARPASCATWSPPTAPTACRPWSSSLDALIEQGVIDYETAVDASLYPQDIPNAESQPVPAGRSAAGLMAGGGDRAARSALPYQILAGVEPCAGRMAGGARQPAGDHPGAPAGLRALLAGRRARLPARPSRVALHAPVGLTEDPGSAGLCDADGQGPPRPAGRARWCRRRRGSCSTPSTFEEAQAIDPTLDIVRWRSLPKAAEAIREVQSWRQRAVWEVNPELAFRQMNDGDRSATAAAPCTAGRSGGRCWRRKLPGTERVLRERPKGVREGKLLDALADLWTARRIMARAITRLSDPPVWDDDGVRMDIVC